MMAHSMVTHQDKRRLRGRLKQRDALQRTRSRQRQPFNLKLWMKSRWEIMTMSMFFSPMMAVFAAIALGFGLSYVDTYMTSQGVDPPIVLTTTVESARVLLSTVAGATISFAGTAFSVSLLVIQLGSSQYSPRIVHTLFKDAYNRRIVAWVVGTFAYCLVVMRSIDNQFAEAEDGSSVVVVPNLSVAVAFILGISSVLAIVAFIDHSANTMDISQLLERVTRDTIWRIQQTWKLETDLENEEDKDKEDVQDENSPKEEMEKEINGDDHNGSEKQEEENQDNPKTPKGKKGEETVAEELDDCHVVRFRTSGWVQEIDIPALLKLVPANGYMKLHTFASRYAIPGTAVCSVFPKPSNKQLDAHNNINFQYEAPQNSPEDGDESDEETQVLEEFDDHVLDAIMIGLSRTMRSDASYGLRQLVDVVLRALSPGINDPTTAQDGIFHIAAVVTEFLHRVPPKSVIETEEDGTLILNEQQDYDSIVRLGFDEARVCASSSPTVALYILEALRLIRESLTAGGYPRRAPEIERQAWLVEEGIRNASHVADDTQFIVKARKDRFDTGVRVENMGIRGEVA